MLTCNSVILNLKGFHARAPGQPRNSHETIESPSILLTPAVAQPRGDHLTRYQFGSLPRKDHSYDSYYSMPVVEGVDSYVSDPGAVVLPLEDVSHRRTAYERQP
jgi:hypothetical protein